MISLFYEYEGGPLLKIKLGPFVIWKHRRYNEIFGEVLADE